MRETHLCRSSSLSDTSLLLLCTFSIRLLECVLFAGFLAGDDDSEPELVEAGMFDVLPAKQLVLDESGEGGTKSSQTEM